MVESKTIKAVEQMEVFDRFKIYMDYYIDQLFFKYTSDYYVGEGKHNWQAKNFNEYCDKSNILERGTDAEDWKERGYASKTWINFSPESIYNYIYLHKK